MIGIFPIYEDINKIYSWICKLYQLQRSVNPGFDPEYDKNQILRASDKEMKFDMSLIESVNEKPIISKPFIVRAIVPLISIFGYIYATIKTLYF